MNFAQSSAVYFNNTLKFAIRDLHQLGYTGIEIWGGRPHMFRNDLDEQLDEILDLLKGFNMKVCNVIPAQFRYPSHLCSLNEKVRRESVDYIKSAVENAVKVGAPTVSVCPGMVPFDEDLREGWKQLVKSYREIDRFVKERDIIALIEPAHRFESNLILTVEDCLRMLNEINSDHFGILLDTGHANVNGERFEAVLPKCQGIPLHIHLDDNNGDFDAHLIPGKGNVDFEGLFKTLHAIHYQGFISAELGGAYNMDPTSACRETLSFLEKFNH